LSFRRTPDQQFPGQARINDLRGRRRNPEAFWMLDQVRHDGTISGRSNARHLTAQFKANTIAS
jgi:hypothetical protein